MLPKPYSIKTFLLINLHHYSKTVLRKKRKTSATQKNKQRKRKDKYAKWPISLGSGGAKTPQKNRLVGAITLSLWPPLSSPLFSSLVIAMADCGFHSPHFSEVCIIIYSSLSSLLSSLLSDFIIFTSCSSVSNNQEEIKLQNFERLSQP